MLIRAIARVYSLIADVDVEQNSIHPERQRKRENRLNFN